MYFKIDFGSADHRGRHIYEVGPDGRIPDIIWMMRTRVPIRVVGMADETWEALDDLQIGIKRVMEEAAEGGVG